MPHRLPSLLPLLLIGACATAQDPTFELLDGDQQHGTVRTPLAAPLRVRLRLPDGRPFVDKLVTFEVTRDDGLLSAVGTAMARPVLRVRTDQSGIAAATWRLGAHAGADRQRVQVRSAGLPGTLTFSAIAEASAPTHLEVLDALPDDAQPGTALALRVRVGDPLNAVGGTPVAFAVRHGGGQLGPESTQRTVTSDADGIASITWTLGERAVANELAIALPGRSHATLLRVQGTDEPTPPAAAPLLPLVDAGNRAAYRGNDDTLLTMAGVDGLLLRVRAGSMRLADGTQAPDGTPLALAQVPGDRIPLPPGAPPIAFAWLLEPADATFDPPIEVTLPNLQGLPPAGSTSIHAAEPGFAPLATAVVARDGNTLTSDPGQGLRRGGLACLRARPMPPLDDDGFDWATEDAGKATPERLQNARSVLDALVASWTAMGWTTSAAHMTNFLHGDRDRIVYPVGSEVSELAAGTLEFFAYVYRPTAVALHARVQRADAAATSIPDFTVPVRGLRFLRADLATSFGEIHPWQSKITVSQVRIDRGTGTYDATIDVELGDRYEFNGVGLEDPYFAARARFLQRWDRVRRFDVVLQHRLQVKGRRLDAVLPWLSGLQGVRGVKAAPVASEPLRYLLGGRPGDPDATGATVLAGLSATVSPGTLTRRDQTAKVAVTARGSDGTVREVGNAGLTTFAVGNPAIAEIDGTGVVRPRASGTVLLAASWRSTVAVTTCTVALADPFTTVEGLVVDAKWQPVANVEVAVAGRTGFTDAQGRFTIGGVPTGARVTVRCGGREGAAVEPVPGGITDAGIVVR